MSTQELGVISRMSDEIKIDISSRTQRKHFENLIHCLKDLFLVIDKKFLDFQYENSHLKEALSQLNGTKDQLERERLDQECKFQHVAEKHKAWVKENTQKSKFQQQPETVDKSMIPHEIIQNKIEEK
jgi:hypothetical protein